MPVVQKKVSDLLSPHPNMVLAVRTFLFRSNECGDDDLEAKIKFMRAVKWRFGEESQVYKQFVELLVSVYGKGGDKAICNLFQGHADLQDALRRIAKADRETLLETQGLAFCALLKRKLADDDKAYLRFLKMMNDQSTGSVELQMFVSDLVGNCPVIMKALDKFLQACEDSAH